MTDQLRAAAQVASDIWETEEDDNLPENFLAAMEALRTALAADAEQCEWTHDNKTRSFESACGVGFQPQLGVFMKFCYGCGKRIKFLESEHE